MEPLRTRHHHALHVRARERGVQPVVCSPARALLEPSALLWLRLERAGERQVPGRGGAPSSRRDAEGAPAGVTTLPARPVARIPTRQRAA